ncbi:MAG: heavy metal resistance protein CzcA [Actinomycetota bacterium]|nr:heavy metal resistance protein CzcA [Actinomycetota bacterium]
MLRLTAEPRSLPTLAQDVEPSWVAAGGPQRQAAARDAVALYLALLSRARGDDGRPLLGVDVQLWIREVSRLLRQLSRSPRFRWHDGAAAEDEVRTLPSVYCRLCGRSGWGVVATAGGGHSTDAVTVWGKSVSDVSTTRAWIFAPGEAARESTDVRWVDAETADFVPAPTNLVPALTGRHGTQVPVLVTPDAQAAKDQQCPSCGRKDGIRYLGSRVATLASVTLGQLFGSPDVAAEEKKTLVFTDSVQDASHRAAFVESRAYALNLRSLVHRAIGADPSTGSGATCESLGRLIEEGARSPSERYALLPTELRDHKRFRPYWTSDDPKPRTRRTVAKRMGFAGILEFGLSTGTGRTLELTGAVTAHVEVENLAAVVDAALAAVARHDVQLTLDRVGPQRTTAWARGIIERIRTQGGIGHEWLRKFAETGNRHSIWGGRPWLEGMPAFPSARPAPSFPTTARHSEAFDSIIGPRGWYATWTARVLGVAGVDAPRFVRELLEAFTQEGVLDSICAAGGTMVWQIPPRLVRLARTDGAPRLLRCAVCATRLPGPELVLRELDGAPCQRDRCSGNYAVERSGHDYYRDLYRGGEVRRIVAREHTSLLPAAERVELENAFKSSARPDTPNVLTCTPTLELGIDIGDLSMVALTSLPHSTASYLQRVGRAGRLTGNALVISLLPARPLELQRLMDPLTMIAGDVVPPACYLDAGEILRRQYLASLFDRRARSPKVGATRLAKDVFGAGLSTTSWLGRIVTDARVHAERYVQEFLRGFGATVTPGTAESLRIWAGSGSPAGEPPGFERAVETAVAAWLDEGTELTARLGLLETEIEKMQAMPSLDEAGDRDLKRLRGEAGAARKSRSSRNSTYWISALESAGLLPNYSLLDDTTRLDVGLWWTDEETGAHEASDEKYLRGSRTALYELAPGATFYVRGTSVEIDGIDLGTSRNPATVTRRFCPACGWSARVESGAAGTACPRCGAVGAADAGQVLATLPFRRASAYASRELAMRDDDTEDRRKARFTVVATVDADHVEGAWELADFPFGAELLPTADIRWINVGPSERGGSARVIAGQEVAAALFEACVHCGVVPVAQRGVRDRNAARHRGWCRQRREPRPEDWRSVALTHELRTQAVRLLIPPIVVADRGLRTSFRAALLLGLRQVLGGDPDHLDVLEAPDPVAGSGSSAGGGQRWVMVIHDLVPGGTGYLGRFTDPAKVRELLAASLEVLERCECAGEGLAACHRCLLPHVPPPLAAEARRDSAIDLIRQILAQWQPRPIETIKRIVVGSHDTPIERRFRDLLVRWAKGKGATVTRQATSFGDRAAIRFPGALGDLAWALEPQVNLGGVRPDFLLTSADHEIPGIAVFCDGQRYHSSAEHNRIADDVQKRAALRDLDYLVWAVTHQDLDAFAAVFAGTAGVVARWCDDGLRAVFVQTAQKLAAPGSVKPAVLLADPMSVLCNFVLQPTRTAWAGPAHGLALALARTGAARMSDASALPELVRAEIAGVASAHTPGKTRMSLRRTTGGAVVALELRSVGDVRVCLAVDDREHTVGSDEQVDAWRDWLALANLLQFLEPGRFQAPSYSTVTQLSERTVADQALPVEWQAIVDVSPPIVRDLASMLAGRIPLPVAGHEVADGEYAIDLAWPDKWVAVLIDDDHERDSWLKQHGWAVVAADERAVLAALRPIRSAAEASSLGTDGGG